MLAIKIVDKLKTLGKTNVASQLESIGTFIKKAVNSDMPHAIDQGVKRNVFPDSQTARTELETLTNKISSGNIPKGTIIDPSKTDRILVPVGNKGMAVYQIGKNGTAKLKTTLISKE